MRTIVYAITLIKHNYGWINNGFTLELCTAQISQTIKILWFIISSCGHESFRLESIRMSKTSRDVTNYSEIAIFFKVFERKIFHSLSFHLGSYSSWICENYGQTMFCIFVFLLYSQQQNSTSSWWTGESKKRPMVSGSRNSSSWTSFDSKIYSVIYLWKIWFQLTKHVSQYSKRLAIFSTTIFGNYFYLLRLSEDQEGHHWRIPRRMVQARSQLHQSMNE